MRPLPVPYASLRVPTSAGAHSQEGIFPVGINIDYCGLFICTIAPGLSVETSLAGPSFSIKGSIDALIL